MTHTPNRTSSWITRAAGALAGALLGTVLCLIAAGPALAASPSAPSASASGSTLTESVSSVPNGATITFSYATPAATVNSTNRIGIYEPGQTPGQVGSTTFQYAPGASGTITFSSANLDGVGSYTAFYLYDNAYQVLAGPVSFSVVPSQPAPAPTFERSVSGTGRGALQDPYGVAAGRGGNLWITDRAASKAWIEPADADLMAAIGNLKPDTHRQVPAGCMKDLPEVIGARPHASCACWPPCASDTIQPPRMEGGMYSGTSG